MTVFPIICCFQVIFLPGTHIGGAALDRADQIRDQVNAGGRIVALRTGSEQPPAGDFRLREIGPFGLGIQLPGQIIGNSQNQCLHAGFVIHEVRHRNTEGFSAVMSLEIHRSK